VKILANSLLPACALITGLVWSQAGAAEEFGNRSADDVDPELRAKLMQAVTEADSFVDTFDAQVWLTDMSNRLSSQVVDADERLEILRIVHRQATRTGLPPELVLAVIDVESNFERYAISDALALGLMQIMPFWIDELDVGDGDMNVLFDIEMNIMLGCQILKFYLEMEGGDYLRGLARYNGSTGQRWYADRVFDALREKWFRL
jgi:soluble lytic murein transglycosylase-like protein